ncbi:asparagine synthase (glutamine-hydrolyzing) [Undibacterium sp.]|uniref:asparagine synthase (glutamine-hydrolyzing) n=1 Tax=Undibacterium sp. TaxID=1914977 RepID=UPI00374C9F2A
MCGILFSTSSQLDDQRFVRALDRMAYRGPDASGVLRSGALQLGHRRLAIIDLDSRSRQPFLSDDGRYAIVFNGEIYNFQELAKRYKLVLRTTSDTEVLLSLYQLKGAAMLNELNGMFAFVIADLVTGQWFAARDRLGVKPLYQTDYGDGIVLSSEPAPLLDIKGGGQFDPVGVRQYRKLRTFFNGRTIWSGISQFPAGHYLESSGQLTRWWQLPEGPQAAPSDEEVHALLVDAVRIREIADVPLGSFLSGGLDSTIVAGLVTSPDTWTVGFGDNNEFEWGRMAAEKFGNRHHEVPIGYEEFMPLAEQMISIRCEPLSVPNEVLIYKMTGELAKHNKVVLSGEGADELFFGYDRIFRWAASSPWDIKQFAALYAYGSADDMEIIEDAVQPFLNRGDALSIVAAFFQVAHLQGLLRRLDSATMLRSVEAREPFVDYRLVERMAGVPFDWRMAGGEVKAPLKRAFANLVPGGIINRPKVGFPVPLASVPFDPSSGATPMDRWFEFNLSTLANLPVTMKDML